MQSLLLSRTTVIWALLVGATLLSWEFGHGIGFSDLRHAGIAIIVVAMIKVRMVILDFMEVRHAPVFMRIGGEAYCAVICAVLVTLFYLPTASVLP
jgi:hypothetical protein